MSKKIEPRIIAKEICNNFKLKYINNKGLISRTYPPTERSIFDYFDDIVPFLDYFGEKDIILSQINLLDNESFEREMAFGGVIFSYKIDEYLGGLNHVWRSLK